YTHVHPESLVTVQNKFCAVYFFFFQYSAHHRDLHSFPTRRSSDLCFLARDSRRARPDFSRRTSASRAAGSERRSRGGGNAGSRLDRKSTRLNSSHSQISYAVFCLKKKKNVKKKTK